jgi:hypothetical protein
MTNNPPSSAKSKEILEARHRLWFMGDLSWKLDATQKKIYAFFKDECKEKVVTVNASRRLGKSFALAIIAIEQCLQRPGSIVKMLQPEQKMVRMNIRPIMDKILRDCPPDLRPQFKTMDNIYAFPNGSEIQLAGTDNGNHEKLRGGDADLAIIDEAGFCSDLKYIINQILIPTTTLTKGRIILSSTTPPNPEHEFVKYLENAETNKTLVRKTIDDAVEDGKTEKKPRITEEIVADIIKAIPGGRESDEFRTEYLCKVIKNSEFAVVPEFTGVKDDVVVNWPRPAFCDRYVSMDIGFKDLTAILFAYYDFDNAVIVIEDEFSINGAKMTTTVVANAVKDKEKELWFNSLTNEQHEPKIRVSDNNLIFLNDLIKDHGLVFLPTDKSNKQAHVNTVRTMMAERRIIINPKCKQLISHVENGTWNKERKDYVRSPDNGHYDFIDALVYLVRNIDQNRNPYPPNYRHNKMGKMSDLFINPHYTPHKPAGISKLEDQFKLKTSFKKFNK